MLEEWNSISIEPVGAVRREEIVRRGQDLPPPIFAPSQHQQPPPVLQSNTQGQGQPGEEEHKMEEVGACSLCKDPVVEREEHNTTLEDIFQEGRELGENLTKIIFLFNYVEEISS